MSIEGLKADIETYENAARIAEARAKGLRQTIKRAKAALEHADDPAPGADDPAPGADDPAPGAAAGDTSISTIGTGEGKMP